MQSVFFTMYPLRGCNRVFAVRSPRQYSRLADAVEAAYQGNMHPKWDTSLGLMTAVECVVSEEGRVYHLAPLPWEVIDCRDEGRGLFKRTHYGESLVGPEYAGYQLGLRNGWHEKRDCYPYGVSIHGKTLIGDDEAAHALVETASAQFKNMVLRYVQARSKEKDGSHNGVGSYYLPCGLAITNQGVHVVADERTLIDFGALLKAA